MFACTGILSNHDSPLRPMRFVTRKIIHAVASLAMGKDLKLSLGNLDIERDWGWAPEYVEAIATMLEQPSPGRLHYCDRSESCLARIREDGLRTHRERLALYVSQDKNLMRPADILRNKVDPSKAAAHLGWKAKYRHEGSDRHDARCGNEVSS